MKSKSILRREAAQQEPQLQLAEHEEMGRWKRLPIWAQQELERWREDEAHARLRAERAEKLLREVRMYALGNDCTTQVLLERVDTFLAGADVNR